MNDLISREALLAKLNAEYDHRKKPSEPEEGLELAIEIVREAGAVDAEPVRHGHWKSVQIERRANHYPSEAFACSECGLILTYRTEYCMDCGAKNGR